MTYPSYPHRSRRHPINRAEWLAKQIANIDIGLKNTPEHLQAAMIKRRQELRAEQIQLEKA